MRPIQKLVVITCILPVVVACGSSAAARPEFLPECSGAASDILAQAEMDFERIIIRDTLVVREAARAIYAPQWSRQALLRVFVDSARAMTQVCLYDGSGEAAFDTAAIEAVLAGEYDRAALNRVATGTWVSFPVVNWMPAPPLVDARFQPIARDEEVRPNHRSEDIIAVQAAVLNWLLPDSIADRLWRHPPRAICVGVGPDLPILDASPELMAALETVPLPVYAASACGVDREGGGPQPVVVMEDGTPAMSYWVDVADPDAAKPWKLMAGFFADGLTAQRWDCFVDLVDSVWEVSECKTTSIS